jgi:hypothetical protein
MRFLAVLGFFCERERDGGLSDGRGQGSQSLTDRHSGMRRKAQARNPSGRKCRRNGLLKPPPARSGYCSSSLHKYLIGRDGYIADVFSESVPLEDTKVKTTIARALAAA